MLLGSERNAVLNEMRDSTDIDDRVASKYYEHMFNETMLPRRFPIGKEKVVVEATSADLRKFYDTHYHPSNMHLFVVGDINPLHMQRVIEAVFGAEPAQPRAGASQLDQPPYTTPDGPMHGWPVRGTSLPHSFGNAPQVPCTCDTVACMLAHAGAGLDVQIQLAGMHVFTFATQICQRVCVCIHLAHTNTKKREQNQARKRTHTHTHTHTHRCGGEALAADVVLPQHDNEGSSGEQLEKSPHV